MGGKGLVWSVERKPGMERPGRLYSQMEICHGPFRRELLLPAEVNPDEARAGYAQGMLEIVLPKVARHISQRVKFVVR